MAAGPETLGRYIRRLVTRPESDKATDAALLSRFISERDETSFAALVDRHGPLVLHVCRRVLGNLHDAEDAFQAAFLVLARKAATVYPREALTAWLHGVAYRVALKARSAKARQLRARQPLVVPPADPHSTPLDDLSARELLALVDEEVRRLPEVYRLPVLLCCLEGRSLEEAARQLGWTLGSVKGRLERGRVKLHNRLVRRGLTLSAALAAVELSRDAGSAAVVARLGVSTVRAARGFAVGPSVVEGASAQAAALAREGVKGMAQAGLRIPAVLVLTVCLLAAGFVAYRAADSAAKTPDDRISIPFKEEKGRIAPRTLALNKAADLPDEEDRRIEVSGRVLDPAGKPFVGARLYVGYAPRRYEPEATAHQPVYPLRATSGPEGRFRFAFTRSELDERYLDASRPVVVAVADGFGLDWVEIEESADLSLRLVEDRPLEGRILDRNRQPVAGVKVIVRTVSTDRSPESFKSESVKGCLGPLPGQPSQVTIAADGRFRLTGVGRDRRVTYVLEGPTIHHLCIQWTSTAVPPGGVDWMALPSRTIRGLVRDKATGKPVPGVKVSVETIGPTTLTDQDGRYELLGYPGPPCVVMAQPQRGQPYFAAAVRLPEKPAADPLIADFNLVSGIPLRGRVTDQATGKPPKRAVVEYYPLFPNAHSSVLTNCTRMMAASSSPLQPDGSYRLMVLPGPGVVMVAASPRDSYAVALLDDKELVNLFGDGRYHGGGSWIHIAVGGGEEQRCVDRYNALALIKPDERAESLALDLTVQPARRRRGTVVGPDGKPLSGVRVSGLTSMPDAETLERASFTVEGLNPRRTRQLIFHHREKGLAKVVTLRGDEPKPWTVQLETCGWISGRLVDKNNKPVPGEMVICTPPGIHGLEVTAAKTDAGGRFRLGLVAGQNYSLRLSSIRRLLREEDAVEVESGRSKDLGDFPLGD
jgi:RNA polymerase sigma factor (sigma-70 family)